MSKVKFVSGQQSQYDALRATDLLEETTFYSTPENVYLGKKQLTAQGISDVVSTKENQGLSSEQKSNARKNIGLGTIATKEEKNYNTANLLTNLKENWESGTINGGNGEKMDLNTRMRTKELVSVESNTQYIISCNSDYSATIVEYLEDKTMSSALNAWSSNLVFTTKSTTKYIFVILRKNDNSVISSISDIYIIKPKLELGSQASIWSSNQEDINSIIQLSESLETSTVRTIDLHALNILTLDELKTYTDTSPAFVGSCHLSGGPGGTGWYNIQWIPHRNGLGLDDNSRFGQLILYGMTVSKGIAYAYYKYNNEWSGSTTFAKTSDIPSLSGYATQSWVESKGYKTTDTTYSDVTTSNHGLMTSNMLVKLNGIAEGANKYESNTTNANALLASLPSNWTATPTDETYLIRKDNTNTNQFGQVKFSTVWEYIKAKINAIGYGTYTKPSSGIPKTDLATAVQASLNKADTALQSHQSLSNLAVNKGLSNTDDLNNITTPGFYNAAGNNTVANSPLAAGSAFGLVVVHTAGGAYYTQILFAYGINTSYRRSCKLGTWGEWAEEKLTDTNTWRGIQDNLTSTSTTDSLSANQGKVLNDKFAKYLPLTGGTLSGGLRINKENLLGLLILNRTKAGASPGIAFRSNDTLLGYFYMDQGDKNFYRMIGSDSSSIKQILDSGNYTDYAVSKTNGLNCAYGANTVTLRLPSTLTATGSGSSIYWTTKATGTYSVVLATYGILATLGSGWKTSISNSMENCRNLNRGTSSTTTTNGVSCSVSAPSTAGTYTYTNITFYAYSNYGIMAWFPANAGITIVSTT